MPRFSRFKRTMSFGMVINGSPPVQAETLWPRVSTELRGRDSVQVCWMSLVLACNGTAPRLFVSFSFFLFVFYFFFFFLLFLIN